MDHDSTAVNQLKEIDSAWVDSLKKQDQTECKEYKQFKHKLELAKTPKSELDKRLLKKELEIVMKTVKKLKLFMNKYKDDPGLVEKIKNKLNLMVGNLDWYSVYYCRDGRLCEQRQVTAETWPLRTNTGAHPEYIMNVFIYNPPKGEKRFKVLRIDGNKVTYQPYRNNEPVGEPIKLGLDEFLKTGISVAFGADGMMIMYDGSIGALAGPRGTEPGFLRDVPIGELYKIFPKRGYVDDTVETYNARVDEYLEYLMRIFANKPATEFFSAPTSGGRRKTHHKRDSNKRKRTHKRRT